MANERRLIVLDYKAVREAFDEEYKGTMQLIKNGETHLDNLAEGFTEADRVLRKMPTVDAVEVVRCKDCVHVTNMCLRNGAVLYKCNRFYEQYGVSYGTWEGPAPVMPPDGFCSDGERRCE